MALEVKPNSQDGDNAMILKILMNVCVWLLNNWLFFVPVRTAFVPYFLDAFGKKDCSATLTYLTENYRIIAISDMECGYVVKFKGVKRPKPKPFNVKRDS